MGLCMTVRRYAIVCVAAFLVAGGLTLAHPQQAGTQPAAAPAAPAAQPQPAQPSAPAPAARRRRSRTRRRPRSSRAWSRSGRPGRSSSARSSITCRCVQGIPTPKDVLGHHVGAPKKLTRTAEALKYYRALEAATPRVKVINIGTTDEGRELNIIAIADEETIKNLDRYRGYLGQLADPRDAHRGAGQGDHRAGQADLSPDGRPAQRRDRPARNADGARLPAGGRGLAADQTDPRQDHRHHHAGRRSGRPRSLRRVVSAPHGRRRPTSATASPGRRTGASTSSTTTTATSTTRR